MIQPSVMFNNGFHFDPVPSVDYLAVLCVNLRHGETLTPIGVRVGWRQWRHMTREADEMGVTFGTGALRELRIEIADNMDDYCEWLYGEVD